MPTPSGLQSLVLKTKRGDIDLEVEAKQRHNECVHKTANETTS